MTLSSAVRLLRAPPEITMPRPQKNPEIFLWLSPAMTATACGVSTAVVRQAILDKKLFIRKIGMKHKISVANIADWYASLPEVEPRKRKSPHD
jgi:hypothetical protein